MAPRFPIELLKIAKHPKRKTLSFASRQNDDAVGPVFSNAIFVEASFKMFKTKDQTKSCHHTETVERISKSFYWLFLQYTYTFF